MPFMQDTANERDTEQSHLLAVGTLVVLVAILEDGGGK